MKEIQFRRTELEDRELMHTYFVNFPTQSCERTFANSLLWSRHYPVKFAIVENTLVFCWEKDDFLAFAYPVGAPENVKNALEFLKEYVVERGLPFILYHVTKEQFEQLEEWYPERFEIEYDRDVADYIYETEKLATLAGKKLHSKRNHINKFKELHPNWSYESMSKDNIEECFQMALKWRNANGCDIDDDKNAEMCVTLNALRLFYELELIGGVLKVDGHVIAFTIGEEVTPDTFVVHIEKAFADVQGAYPMINQQFVSNECMNYQYTNREDDTGSEGLRKAKLSYRPAYFVEKGIVKEKVQ